MDGPSPKSVKSMVTRDFWASTGDKPPPLIRKNHLIPPPLNNFMNIYPLFFLFQRALKEAAAVINESPSALQVSFLYSAILKIVDNEDDFKSIVFDVFLYYKA